MSAARLDVRALEAGYRGGAVVHGIDLTVGAGEVVALLGPNGAGKTTTLMTISELLPRIGGDVSIFGEPRSRRTGRSFKSAIQLARAGVAHVPENRSLFPGLTGREHLRLATRGKDAPAIDEVIGVFPALGVVIDRRAGLMSGGEQQMLAVARALVARPRLLMVDELSLGLAPIVVERILAQLRDFAVTRELGVLLVEQHVASALAVADRAYVMVGGHIRLHERAADLAADPDRIAATYLGGASPDLP